MIIYRGTCGQFIDESISESPNIGSIILDCFSDHCITNHSNGDSEFRSWNSSLPELAKVLEISNVPKDAEIGIEYMVKRNNYRIDAMICGKNRNGIESVVIVELKQWSTAEPTSKQNYVHTVGGDGPGDYWHPSYQALNYAGIIENFYVYVQETPVIFNTCSYLHNMDPRNLEFLGNKNVYPLLDQSPVFVKGDKEKLAGFISDFIKTSSRDLLYRIDQSAIRPSKKLAEILSDALHGNEFFSYSDEQADAVSSVVELVRDSVKYGEKRTIVIKGGPGTGKSIVAVNILGQLIEPRVGKRYNAAYFTANASPRRYYEKKLTGKDFKKKILKNLFKYPTALVDSPTNEMDCSLFDEAHRLFKWKGGTGVKKEVNIVERCIEASKVSVFFIDEDQAVTVNDYVTIDLICELSEKCGSKVIIGPELTSQFRVVGGINYLNFVKNLLGYDNAEPYSCTFDGYEFKIFDKASEMRDALREKNNQYGLSRMVAGYTFDWKTKYNYDAGFDIILDNGDFQAKWNMNKKDYSWLYDDNSFENIGSIHTCQGLDLEYCGVILGKDIRFENGKIIFDQTKIAKSDNSSGIRTCKDKDKAESLIRNTYNVLLTRGIRGTYIYCEDIGLKEHIRSLILSSPDTRNR